MGRSFSIYLDGIRFLASIVVLLHHFALPSLTDGNYELIRALHLGDRAVIVFFVLSGYVVAYAADQKERTPLTYFFNRATRMYSVALPAVCVTLALDAIGARVNPESYQGWDDPTVPELDELWRALTFTNQLGFGNHRIGTNGPYWSLGYEVWYYVLFGLAVFWHGRIKYVLLAITSLLVGPKILLLMPAWCFGALAYHRVSRGPGLERRQAIFYAAVPLLACILLAAAHVPRKLQTATSAVLGADFVSRDMYYSSAFAWDAVLGGLVAIHFAGMAHLTSRLPELPRGLRRHVRWLAGATFSIYVFHYPTLMFVNAVLPRELASMLRHSALLGITVALCFVFAQLFERQLERTRSLLVCAWACGTRRLERPGRV